MVTYNLVNSVKGGCGKTTFSIWLSYYLNNMEDIKEGKKVDHTALLIDMDLLGTSMQFTFDGNAPKDEEKNHNEQADAGAAGESKTESEKNFEEMAYTNDIFKGVKGSKKSFVRTIKWNNGKAINAIFASMKTEERDKFKSGRHSGYAPTVRHSIFRAGVKELIKTSEYVEEKKVKHFIFDMPPNSDGFSDAAMECIFSKKHSDLKKKNRKNLFFMVGSDLGQTIATRTELAMLLKRKDEMMPDRIFIVFNHNIRGELGSEGYVRRMRLFQNVIKHSALKENEMNSIYFLIMCEGDEYAKQGIGDKAGGIGLQNVKEDLLKAVFPDTVISGFAKCTDEKFTDMAEEKITEKKLLELVLGED